jgi:hypothetical protein
MEDETAAAAAATLKAGPVCALPADKESQIFSCGEEKVAGNLSAKTSVSTLLLIPSAGAEGLKRVFAADRGGEGLHRPGKHKSFGVRLGRSGQNCQGRRPGEQKSFR